MYGAGRDCVRFVCVSVSVFVFLCFVVIILVSVKPLLKGLPLYLNFKLSGCLFFFFFFFFLSVCNVACVLRCGIWVHIRHNYVWMKTVRRLNVNKQQPGLCFEAKSPRQRQGNLFKISPSPATLVHCQPRRAGWPPFNEITPLCRVPAFPSIT